MIDKAFTVIFIILTFIVLFYALSFTRHSNTSANTLITSVKNITGQNISAYKDNKIGVTCFTINYVGNYNLSCVPNTLVNVKNLPDKEWLTV